MSTLKELIDYAEDASKDGYPFEVTDDDLKVALEALTRSTELAAELARIRSLEAKFAHPYAKSINPKSGACAVCGLHGTDAIHVPARERSDFEKAIIAGFTAETEGKQ